MTRTNDSLLRRAARSIARTYGDLDRASRALFDFTNLS